MSKHFKMYIIIIDIIGQKRINLAYPIRGKEVAVASMFSDNIEYDEFKKPWMLDCGPSSSQIAAGTYTRRELIDLGEGKMEITQFDKDSRIKRMNKSEGITEMVFNLRPGETGKHCLHNINIWSLVNFVCQFRQ